MPPLPLAFVYWYVHKQWWRQPECQRLTDRERGRERCCTKINKGSGSLDWPLPACLVHSLLSLVVWCRQRHGEGENDPDWTDCLKLGKRLNSRCISHSVIKHSLWWPLSARVNSPACQTGYQRRRRTCKGNNWRRRGKDKGRGKMPIDG